LKPEKFDIEMTEASGITGNEWCLVLIAVTVWKRMYYSAIFALPNYFYNLFLVPLNKKHKRFFSYLWDILRSRVEANAS